MTISSTTSRISYAGNGATLGYAVPFRFDANADLAVYLLTTATGVSTLQVLGTDYTLSGAGVSSGGTCTFTTAPATGKTVIIYRDPTLSQTTSYSANDAFPAASHEAALDKGVMIDQRTRDIVSRAVHLADGDTTVDMALPTVTSRASKFMAFDASGQPTASAGTATGAAVSTTMQPVVEAATLATALTDLGLVAYTTGGTSTAFTVTTTQAFASLAALDKHDLIVIPHTTSGAAPTLNVDGLGAKALRSATGVAVASGALLAGTPYRVTYLNSTTEFILGGPTRVATGFGLTGGPITGEGTVSVSSTAPPHGYDMPINMSLSASVNTLVLTVALKDAAGNDPSATSPVLIPFRDTTAGTGTISWVAVTSALSIATIIGATLGMSANVPFRLWVEAFNNGGTAVLALFNASTQSSTAVTIYPLREAAAASTTAMSAAATAAGTFYTPSGTTLASKAFRALGYVEYGSGLAVPGSYSSAPSIVHLHGPGGRLPGAVVQKVYTSTTSTTATTISSATKANTGLSLSITPTSGVNPILVRATGSMQNSTTVAANSGLHSIFRGTNATPIGTMGIMAADQSNAQSVPAEVFDSPQTASATTYGTYIQNPAAGAWVATFLSTGKTAGTQTGTLTAEEIMG